MGRALGPPAARVPAALPFLLICIIFLICGVYLNAYFITSLQHIIPTLSRAEFCMPYISDINFFNDSLKLSLKVTEAITDSTLYVTLRILATHICAFKVTFALAL